MKKSELRQIIREEISQFQKPQLSEGTTAQVGFINRSGGIVTQYVGYDGHVSNMRGAIKKQFKTLISLKRFIVGGGASGIYAGEPINYYGDSKPIRGFAEDIEGFIRKAQGDGAADYVYLYDQKTKTWLYTDNSDKLVKLYK